MKSTKNIKTTIIVAVFVSLASLVRLELWKDGFIIALSVVMLSIFLYTYENLSPLYIAGLAGIFSPLFRTMMLYWGENTLFEAAKLAVPDTVFFISYGLVYVGMYKFVIRAPKTMRNFPIVIMTADFLSNIMELLCRQGIFGENLLRDKAILVLFVVAICRTFLVQIIIISMEAYGLLLVNKEHDEEYKKLTALAVLFNSELYFMKKDIKEIEAIMKDSYELHKELEKRQESKDLSDISLSISKNAHEVKGHYQNSITTFEENLIKDLSKEKFSIKDIVAILKYDINNSISKKKLSISFSDNIKENFYINRHFELMAILRNLLVNGIEAIDGNHGAISLDIFLKNEEYYFIVKDNGIGISDKKLSDLYTHGFSTKYNYETGDVQRGVGMVIVKDYVENIFHGTIEVETQVGKYTKFTVRIPKDTFEEV
ncbi:MAG: ATP-binding protein [Anaerovoracaceae bacterium]